MGHLVKFAALALATLFATAALAQYPARPVRIIVPYPPGGALDLQTRILAQRLSEVLAQPVVAENRPGSNGNIAGDLVAKATPDGYTLLLGQDSMFVINPHIYPKMAFDPMKDLVPVTSTATNEFFLAVNPDVPVKTFSDFIEYARKAKPPLLYASAGNGSQHHLGMEMLKQRAGIDLVHVPYKGGTPAAMATAAGEVQAFFSGASLVAQVKAGKLRALASSALTPSRLYPELPTIADFYPGYELTVWYGVFVPPGTSAPIVTTLRAAVNKVLPEPEVGEKLINAGGMQPWVSTPEEFAARMRRDYEKYGKLIKEIGVTAD
jgi:tripartite-type tricarboxylate transporter receptor subunit TctC